MENKENMKLEDLAGKAINSLLFSAPVLATDLELSSAAARRIVDAHRLYQEEES